MAKHKYAKVLKWIADGKEILYREVPLEYHHILNGIAAGYGDVDLYTLAPEVVVEERKVSHNTGRMGQYPLLFAKLPKDNNVRFTFDKKTGVLISVEKI